jgi:MYXO-CTERM domain-containing protein
LPALRKALAFGSPIFATLLVALPVSATTWYVAPAGASLNGCVTRDAPCSLASAAAGAVAGDTVILTDGVYKTSLYVANSGTAEAWITFKADECSVPIIEGPGVAPDADNKDSGVGSATASYLRFDGIVSRGWNTGFGNGWTGSHTPDSNGNWEIQNCIGDMNGRTGFTFFSASGVKLKHSISAHNGSSTLHSWSSGVTLYASPGGALIEGNVSFENMDAQKHTDGSGFIADETSSGAIFINNLAFLNGGSCLRLTRSDSVKFINNTCYFDAQDPLADYPDNPDELYFTGAQFDDLTTVTNISFVNNVLVASGKGAGLQVANYTPTSGWSNNVTAIGAVTHFAALAGDRPDFTIAAGASVLVGKGTTGAGVPSDDLGLDPKCLVKKTPTMIGSMAKGDWWQHSIDYEYIKSIGGVAKCFNPKARSGSPDLGSYANGPVTTAALNTCTPPAVGTGIAGGPATTGGSASGGSAIGGSATGGGSVSGGSASSGGAPATAGSGGAPATAGAVATDAGTSPGSTPGADAGCGCRIARDSSSTALFAGLGLLGLGVLSLRRRRA